MKNLINQFIKNEDGVTAIEYAVIGVAMAGGLVIAMGTADVNGGGTGFLGAISSAFKKIAVSMGVATGK